MIEIKLPQVSLSLKDGETVKRMLSYQDCCYIQSKNFKEWIQYTTKMYFRKELNIGANEALPRIEEVKLEETISEEDLAIKFPPSEVEKV